MMGTRNYIASLLVSALLCGGVLTDTVCAQEEQSERAAARKVKRKARVKAASEIGRAVEPNLDKTFAGSQHLTIWVRENPDPTDWGESAFKRRSAAWVKTCKQMGSVLLAGQGPWGTGYFGSFSCFLDKRKIFGSDKPVDWVLNVRSFEGQVYVQMTRGGVSQPLGEAVEMSSDEQEDKSLLQLPAGAVISEPFKFALQGVENTPWVFFDREVLDLLVLGLMDSMPASMVIMPRQISLKKKILKIKGVRVPAPEKAPLPYASGILYHMEYDAKANMFQPQVVGVAKRVLPKKPVKASKKKGKKSNADAQADVKTAVIGYKLGGKTNAAHYDRRKPLYFHNLKGPGKRYKGYAKLLQKQALVAEKNAPEEGLFAQASQVFLDSIFDSISGGYVGLRYGHPLIGGEQFVSKAAFYGLLVEMRGGPLEGLRFYYDIVPEITESINGESFKYGWSRFTLGWSFGFNPGFLLTRLDLTPKLGLWNADSELPVSSSTGDTTTKVPFKIDNGLAVGAELGGEIDVDWMMVRLWGASDFGLSLVQDDENGSVTANRGGLDIWVEGPSLGETFNLSFLVFALYEAITMKKDTTDENIPLELTLGQFYGGAGLSLSW